jgi:hypothetical protein
MKVIGSVYHLLKSFNICNSPFWQFVVLDESGNFINGGIPARCGIGVVRIIVIERAVAPVSWLILHVVHTNFWSIVDGGLHGSCQGSGVHICKGSHGSVAVHRRRVLGEWGEETTAGVDKIGCETSRAVPRTIAAPGTCRKFLRRPHQYASYKERPVTR